MTPKEYTFDAAYQPQVRAKRGTREIMLDVIIALLPALCVGVWQFGAQALIPLAVSIVSCVFFEWAYRKLMKKPDSIGDLSAVVTGILLAYTLPANCKWWLPIIGWNRSWSIRSGGSAPRWATGRGSPCPNC